MRKLVVLLTLTFISTSIWGQTSEYRVRRIEVEPSFGMGRGVNLALEARVNINSYWDVGFRASMSNLGSASMIVSDYNFARPNKNFLFFVGGGLGWGEHDRSGYVDGPSNVTDEVLFMPRAGIELFQHLRLSLNIHTYNLSDVYPILSIGIVFGGGRKQH